MEAETRQQKVEALAGLLLAKIEASANALDVVLMTRRTKTVEKEEGISREEVTETQEALATGVIDHRAVKNLTSALKDLKSLLPTQAETAEAELRLQKLRRELEDTGEKSLEVIFRGGEDGWTD